MSALEDVVYNLPRASALRGERPLTTLVLRFEQDAEGRPRATEGPTIGWLEDARGYYAMHAKRVVRELLTHCPQGFMDALLVELLDAKRCVLQVPADLEKVRAYEGREGV